MIGARHLAGVLLAISLGLAATPALAQTPEQHQFTIDSYTYTVPVPDGFCVPVDGQVALAEQVAALDAMNFTHAAFDRCGSFGVDYVHIKSPRESERVPLTKPMFIDLAARQIQSAAGQQMMDDAMAQAGRNISEGTNNAVALGTPVPRFAGQDADCAYLFIAADVVMGDKTVAMISATCLTLVEGQFMSVHAYATRETGVTEQELKERSRAIAAAIMPKP
jgi:hypothetical protein